MKPLNGYQNQINTLLQYRTKNPKILLNIVHSNSIQQSLSKIKTTLLE